MKNLKSILFILSILTLNLVFAVHYSPPQAATTKPIVYASCQKALATIFDNEGGYQCMKADSGNWTGGKVGKGVLKGTKYGIAAASYPKVDIKNLTLPMAARYYERDYWNPLNASNSLSQGFATTVLDTAVNCGVGTAGVLFGKMRNIVTGKGINAPVDPNITREDWSWFNDYARDKTRRIQCYLIFQALRSERYVAIAKKDRNKHRFLDDWLVRTWE